MVSVNPGDVFGDLTVASPGSKMQRVLCVCRTCNNKCRVIAYCLINGKKKRCDKCEDILDTTWKPPSKWINPSVDPRNLEIIAARKAKDKSEYVRRPPE